MRRHSLYLLFILAGPALAEPPAKYAAAIKAVDTLIERERIDAGIPGISIAIVAVVTRLGSSLNTTFTSVQTALK